MQSEVKQTDGFAGDHARNDRLGNTNYEKPQNGVKIQLFCLV